MLVERGRGTQRITIRILVGDDNDEAGLLEMLVNLFGDVFHGAQI